MTVMFWKKGSTPQDGVDDRQEKPGGVAGSPQSLDRGSRNHGTSQDLQEGAAEASRAKSGRRLIIGAVVGMLIFALSGLAAWKLFPHAAKQNTTVAETPALSQPIPLPGKPLIKLPSIEMAPLRKFQNRDPETGIETLRKDNNELQTQIGVLRAQLPQLERAQAEQAQANIDALAKKNNELQAQIDALTKKQQQPSAPPPPQTAGKVQPHLRGGAIAIRNEDPKASATALKAAIEAMNAGSVAAPPRAAK